MVQAPPVAPGCGGPQCRTVSSIMQSCLLTIIACVWSSAHPNIDGPRDSGWTRLKRKVIRMFYTVLAPETVLYWAVSQWLAAKTIAEKYNEEFATTGEAETAPGSWGNMIAWFRPLARDTTRRGRGQPWSMTHGFFIQMGGFILYDDEYPTEVLDYELLAKLLRNDAIEALTVTERDLEDHSKGDAVSKGIVVLQTTWFMLQCCARMGQRLPLSELEVLTLAFAVLNVAIYALWWNKPQGGDMAICVPLKQAGAEADDSTTPSTNADARGNPSDNIHRPECRRSNDGLPLIPPHEQQPDKRTTHDRRIGWTQVQQLHNSSYFLPFHPLHRGVSTTFFSLCKIMGIFRVELKREELRMPMFYVGASGMDNSVDALNVSCAIGTVFGAIHLLAWSSNFVFWRISAIVFTVWPLLMLAAFRPWKAETISRPLMYSFAFMFGSYFSTRLIAIYIALSAMRHAPRGVLQDVSWTSYIPHL